MDSISTVQVNYFLILAWIGLLQTYNNSKGTGLILSFVHSKNIEKSLANY